MDQQEQKEQTETIIPVVLCGGSGTRLWPLSRERMPKQFLNLLGDQTLLQQTVRRALTCTECPADHIVTVTLGDLASSVEQQLADLDSGLTTHILHEPMARNTAGAVALAALYVKETFGPNAIMWVLPSDHHIADDGSLKAAYQKAKEAAVNDYLVTFGIKPTRPETGYGYIEVGTAHEIAGVFQATGFIEKPHREKAESLVAAGTYLWNSGMFMFKADTVLRNFHRYALDILSVLLPAVQDIREKKTVKHEAYARLPEQPFDKAIMEKTDKIAVVPCDMGWSDIGSWESLWELNEKDENGNVLMGNAVIQSSRNVFVKSSDRLVACVGVDDVVVVDAGDALLVMDKSGSDQLRTTVGALKKDERAEISQPSHQGAANWSMNVLKRDNGRTIKSYHIKPGRAVMVKSDGATTAAIVMIAGNGIAIRAGSRDSLNRHSVLEVPVHETCQVEAAPEGSGVELLLVESGA